MYFFENIPFLVTEISQSDRSQVGGKLSLADILFYPLLLAPGGFFDDTEGAKASFQSSPKVKAAMEAVDALPQLKEYFASRKVTPF